MSNPSVQPAPGPFAPPTGEPAGGAGDRDASATTTAVVPAPASAEATLPAPSSPAPRSRRGTPTPVVLRWLRRLAVLTVVLFGVTSIALMLQTRHAMDTAARNTAQYVRVQQIQASLLSAHANAANGFLLGGNDTAEQQQDFREDLARANRLLMESSNEEPADREALTALSNAVSRYTSTIEAARVANRQGLPVGQARLDEASALLTEVATPLLTSLGEANTARVEGNTRTFPSIIILGVGALALAALLLTSVVVARRTHRVLNPGLAAAIAAVILATYLGQATLAQANGTIRTTRDGALQTTRASATARAFAYDAKAMESLALLSRASSGGQHEAAWSADSYHARQALRQVADPATSAELQQSFKEWVKVHRKIRDADLGGDYTRAVALATGTGEGSSNAAFDAFDERISRVVDEQGAQASQSLGGLGRTLLTRLLALAGLTLAAVVAASAGVGQRLKEYQ